MKARIVAPSSALGELKNLQAGLELLGSWGIQLESLATPRVSCASCLNTVQVNVDTEDDGAHFLFNPWPTA